MPQQAEETQVDAQAINSWVHFAASLVSDCAPIVANTSTLNGMVTIPFNSVGTLHALSAISGAKLLPELWPAFRLGVQQKRLIATLAKVISEGNVRANSQGALQVLEQVIPQLNASDIVKPVQARLSQPSEALGGDEIVVLLQILPHSGLRLAKPRARSRT